MPTVLYSMCDYGNRDDTGRNATNIPDLNSTQGCSFDRVSILLPHTTRMNDVTWKRRTLIQQSRAQNHGGILYCQNETDIKQH